MAPETLEPLDQQIIAALSRDGRRPYREIARALDVSEGTIRQRVGRLVDKGVIRIAAVGSPLLLGFEAVALIHIQVRPGTIDQTTQILADMPHVRFVGTSFGSADIIIQSIHSSTNELYHFVSNTLPKLVPTIVRTDTFQLTNVVKSSWTWEDWFATDGVITNGASS
jgi:Lrp/AsnC family transcriptional regulator, regulator for asnA, asnC and gidA